MSNQQIQPDMLFENRKRGSSGEMLTQAASEYIEAHCREKFSLQSLADSLFVNKSYLLRVFRKHTGYTPLAYHNHLRCKRAKELLVSTGEEISEIGEMVGFVSSAHFSHVFRKTEGCTPTEYRLNHRTYWNKEAGTP